MSLSNPDARRALRAVVDACVLLGLVALLFVVTDKLSGNADQLAGLARGALIILGLGTLFYGAENVTRAIKLTAPGFSADIAGEEAAAAAADKVAGAATDAADEVKEGTKP